MTRVQHVLGAAALALAADAAQAQFVKGNEAVQVRADGSRKVGTPPLPAATLGAPCPAIRPTCTPSGWRMVETADGLQECTEFFARPGTCRASTYGIEKRPRVWIIKLRGAWMQCEYPDIRGRCISTRALPNIPVQ